MNRRPRSKAVAAWLAVLGGAFGAHRFYLRGWLDTIGWLHWPPTLAGLVGWARVQEFGIDDRLSWLLLPLGGLSVAAAMLMAIVSGLTPDAAWNARHNPGTAASPSGWAAVLAVITALLLGTVALMSAITYGVQRYFEVRLESSRAVSAASASAPRQRSRASLSAAPSG